MKNLKRLFLCVFLGSCGFIKENISRDLSTGVLSGYVVETSLSKEELQKNGAYVRYKFENISLAYGEMFPSSNIKYLENHHTFYEKSFKRFSLDGESFEKEESLENILEEIREYLKQDIKVAFIDSPLPKEVENLAGRESLLNKNIFIQESETHSSHVFDVLKNGFYETIPSPSLVYAYEIVLGDDLPLHPQYDYLQWSVAVDKALSQKAKILNFSGSYGGHIPSLEVMQVESRILEETLRRNIFVVLAGGNQSSDISSGVFLPIHYGFKNMISVASFNKYENEIYDYSNYGPGITLSVDVPSYYSGTSYAAPYFSYLLTWYLALFPEASLEQVLLEVKASCVVESGEKRTQWGRLNSSLFLRRALEKVQKF